MLSETTLVEVIVAFRYRNVARFTEPDHVVCAGRAQNVPSSGTVNSDVGLSVAVIIGGNGFVGSEFVNLAFSADGGSNWTYIARASGAAGGTAGIAVNSNGTDVYLANNRLTTEEYSELCSMLSNSNGGGKAD